MLRPPQEGEQGEVSLEVPEFHFQFKVRHEYKRCGDWCQTYSGVAFWPLDPQPEEVCLEDIAHSLAQQCRFAGHTSEFYSVAQHCVRVAEKCPPEDALWGLLHDASEAYLLDLPRPLRQLPELAAYREAEAAVMRAVCTRFRLPEEQPGSVTRADHLLLVLEAQQFMAGECAERLKRWAVAEQLASTPSEKVVAWGPRRAKTEFLWMAHRLGAHRLGVAPWPPR
jgi:hypothetical protein